MRCPNKMGDTLLHSAAATINQQYHIHHWQERDVSGPELAEQGIVARLVINCQDSLQYLVQQLEAEPTLRLQRHALRRCLGILRLWSDGYSAASGALDQTLDRSRNLRLVTLSILRPMCKALLKGTEQGHCSAHSLLKLDRIEHVTCTLRDKRDRCTVTRCCQRVERPDAMAFD